MASLDLRSDPLAFETLRHRISTIADEGSFVLSMVSSSPVASEANDCNVAVMDASGAAVAVGPGIIGHGIGCMMTARFVCAEYQENPGIRAGDMFLANDPYRCNRHQTCFALVAPVTWDGQIVAWVGAGIHVPDAGGPVAGQVGVGALSIYQEATPMLPVRVVEKGRIRKDLEAEFVIRSRTPQQLSLDLRAMIAACDRLSRRLVELCERHGADGLTGTFEDMIAFNRAHMAERLRRIPDGEWQSSIWLDYPQGGGIDYYECNLALRKRESRLTLDFGGSSPQAPAVINCGEPGLIAGVTTSLMALLGYGLPLCPEAVLRVVEVESRPGTFVHATHPAGCSKGTTAAQHAVTLAVNLAVSRMFLAVPELESRAIAGSSGFLPITDMQGVDQRGAHFGTVLLDSLTGGYGAMPGKDGIDSAGSFGSPFQSIGNVETYEARYPILYLWRRYETDSGGLGTFRGGLGGSRAFTPHGTGQPLELVLHGAGCAVPSTPGVAGGGPGGTNTFAVARRTQVQDRLAQGCLPQAEEQLGGQLEQVPGLYQTQLSDGDVVIVRSNGGGGLGDPLERAASSVAADVGVGAVSPEWAERGYGVMVDDGRADHAATEQLRERMRGRRRESASRIKDRSASRMGLGACPRCQQTIGSDSTLVRHRRAGAVGASILPFDNDQAFRAEDVLCASCGLLIDLRIRKRIPSE